MKFRILFSISLLTAFFVDPQFSKAQLNGNLSYTPAELVNDFFNSGVLVSISNVTFNGISADSLNTQIGLFSEGFSTGLPIDSGLVISNSPLTSFFTDSSQDPNLIFLNNDSDMEILMNALAQSCAILEFDVTVDADALAFNYVFGSTEYQAFTCSVFNDGFGFFVSGPGINGSFSNNAVNIATIPNSETPVGINTLNSGSVSGFSGSGNCDAANPNWQNDSIYFMNNQIDFFNGTSNYPSFIGHTVNLEALINVVFGATYHMKLAICNANDGALPSYVFLEGGSFEGRLASSVRDRDQIKFELSPNPSSDLLWIEVASSLSPRSSVQIFDAQGRLVRQFQLQGAQTFQMDISDLHRGIYVLQLRDENGYTGTGKFIKE